MAQPINMLVVGECGDGKSTLVNGLRDPQQSMEPLCGRNPKGVTKDVVLYRCPDLDGNPFNLIDTPGVGDGDITPVALIALIEAFLKRDMVPGGIRGVIVTTPTADCRIKLGAQVVQVLVSKGFVAAEGRDQYENIILVGTKTDKAGDEEKATFMDGIDGDPSVRELFFELAVPPGKGCAVMVSKTDYTPLLEAIKGLPVVSILYKAPEPAVLRSALAEKLGMEAEAFEGELSYWRDMVAQQGAQIQAMMQRQHEMDLKHREETRDRDERMARMHIEMVEDQRRVAAERERREREIEQLRRQDREEAVQERLQERQQAQERWREHQQRQEQAMNQMRQEAEARERRHEASMREMQAQMQAECQRARAERQTVVVERGGGCIIC